MADSFAFEYTVARIGYNRKGGHSRPQYEGIIRPLLSEVAERGVAH